MNPALIVALVRQRLASPIRAVLLLVLFFFPLLFVAAVPTVGLAGVDNAFLFALVMGVGLVGQDVSSGVLQLILARPVSRQEYALSRWMGAGFSAAAIAVAQVALAAAIVTVRGAPVESLNIVLVAGKQITSAFGTAAVLLLFSSLVPSTTDLLVLFALKFTSTILPIVGTAMSRSQITAIGTELGRWAPPEVDFRAIPGGVVTWHAVATYLSMVAISLALAVVILNRKELSYAAG